MGETGKLAKEHQLVISVPDSVQRQVMLVKAKLGFDCKYDIGLIRNHYVGRTFISPGKTREQKVRTNLTVRGVIEVAALLLMINCSVQPLNY